MRWPAENDFQDMERLDFRELGSDPAPKTEPRPKRRSADDEITDAIVAEARRRRTERKRQ